MRTCKVDGSGNGILGVRRSAAHCPKSYTVRIVETYPVHGWSSLLKSCAGVNLKTLLHASKREVEVHHNSSTSSERTETAKSQIPAVDVSIPFGVVNDLHLKRKEFVQCLHAGDEIRQ